MSDSERAHQLGRAMELGGAALAGRFAIEYLLQDEQGFKRFQSQMRTTYPEGVIPSRQVLVLAVRLFKQIEEFSTAQLINTSAETLREMLKEWPERS